MNQNQTSEDHSFRTIVLAIVFVPLILWLLYAAFQKNSQSSTKMKDCQQKCAAEGHSGYDFQWPIFASPRCTCL